MCLLNRDYEAYWYVDFQNKKTITANWDFIVTFYNKKYIKYKI